MHIFSKPPLEIQIVLYAQFNSEHHKHVMHTPGPAHSFSQRKLSNVFKHFFILGRQAL